MAVGLGLGPAGVMVAGVLVEAGAATDDAAWA